MSEPLPLVIVSAPVPPSKILSPLFPIRVSSPAPPYNLSFVESDELESKVSLPPLPFRVSAPPLPLRTLALLSPFSVSALDPPVRFSKLVALAVVKVSVVFVAGVLSSKDKVSVPAPPSSLVMFALPIAGVPFDPVSITETESSPAPISILSPFFSLAE